MAFIPKNFLAKYFGIISRVIEILIDMGKKDSFLRYSEADLKFEFNMLIGCKSGISDYSDPFLKNLCLEGFLLHAR